MTRSTRTMAAIATVLAVTALIQPVAPAASIPAFSIAGTTISHEDANFSMGYTFTTNVPIAVTHLGIYVPDYDPVTNSSESHPSQQVGIFLAATTALITPAITVSDTDTPVIGINGPSGDHNGYFRYHALPSELLLLPDITYAIFQTTTPVDGYMYNHTGGHFDSFTVSPEINFGPTGLWVVSDSLTYATKSDGAGNYYALPNFLFLVPEPASLSLLALGGLLTLRRQKR